MKQSPIMFVGVRILSLKQIFLLGQNGISRISSYMIHSNARMYARISCGFSTAIMEAYAMWLTITAPPPGVGVNPIDITTENRLVKW